jgi:hypothetical protein
MFEFIFDFNDIVFGNFGVVDFPGCLLFGVNNQSSSVFNFLPFEILYKVIGSFFLWKIAYFIHSYGLMLIFCFLFLFLASPMFYPFLRFLIYIYISLLNFLYRVVTGASSKTQFTDPINVNFLTNLYMFISYFRTSWILYLEWEYKLIFQREILHNLSGPVLKFILVYLYTNKYVYL